MPNSEQHVHGHEPNPEAVVHWWYSTLCPPFLPVPASALACLRVSKKKKKAGKEEEGAGWGASKREYYGDDSEVIFGYYPSIYLLMCDSHV